MKRAVFVLLALIGELVASSTSQAVMKRVSLSGNNTTGDSWSTAYTDVQSGIDAVAGGGGGEVWVMAGTYTESIIIPNGVSLYGGV